MGRFTVQEVKPGNAPEPETTSEVADVANTVTSVASDSIPPIIEEIMPTLTSEVPENAPEIAQETLVEPEAIPEPSIQPQASNEPVGNNFVHVVDTPPNPPSTVTTASYPEGDYEPYNFSEEPYNADGVVPEPSKPWMGQDMFVDKRERFGFVFFVLPILIMSFVSMRHLVDFFAIGSTSSLSWLQALAFESLSIATILGLVLLTKIKRWALWSALFLLYALQMVGNMYASFAHIDPTQAIRLFQFFGLVPSEISAQRIVALVQAGILPTVTTIFTKLTSDYLKRNRPE